MNFMPIFRDLMLKFVVLPTCRYEKFQIMQFEWSFMTMEANCLLSHREAFE